jgi:hypothetical protein
LFNDNGLYELRNVKSEYALDKVLAEDYTIKIILPEGVVNPQIYIGDRAIDMSTVHK